MKTLRFKLTPRPESGLEEVTWYSCPDIKHSPEKTLAHIQKVADNKHIGIVYSLASDLEYFAVRGARAWILTEPGDTDADYNFRVALVKAGMIHSVNTPVMMMCNGVDDIRIQVITETAYTTINTKTGEITVAPIQLGTNTYE